MKIQNLDPTKYKRFFAFGCSFTNHNWPTWADIIGKDIEVYANWGKQAAGNYFIFNSAMEADARYNFTKDDLVIIFWTIKEREDRYSGNEWVHFSPYNIEANYGKEWTEKYYFDNRHYLMRDITLIKATQDILKTKECDWANLSWGDFLHSDELKPKYDIANKSQKITMMQEWRAQCKNIYKGGEIPKYIDNNDIITLYQSIFNDFSGVYKWFRTECLDEARRISPGNDLHPMPSEALMFLDWVWPDNLLSSNARNYANNWVHSGHTMPRPPVIRL